jgi:hypothetical protein
MSSVHLLPLIYFHLESNFIIFNMISKHGIGSDCCFRNACVNNYMKTSNNNGRERERKKKEHMIIIFCIETHLFSQKCKF